MVGAGAAGLYTALSAALRDVAVTLVSATPLAESSSYWAQGGLAAAMSDDDSPELHLADTIAAGRGAVRESAARVLCEEAPSAVQHLAELGVQFDADRNGRLALGLEGGHSAGGSSTQAAPPPGGDSSGNCPRSSPRTTGSTCSRAGVSSRC